MFNCEWLNKCTQVVRNYDRLSQPALIGSQTPAEEAVVQAPGARVSTVGGRDAGLVGEREVKECSAIRCYPQALLPVIKFNVTTWL